ncbi:MAG: hypothetical protein J6N22_05085, partial [Schwartzia sp.]|nr:hypothetical protein [Schwartzia sp. (in: firmicutes)]
YKIKGTLSPIRFNRALRELDVQEDILRTNYCDMGDRVLAVVTNERKNAETVIFNNLQGRDPEEINTMLRRSAAAALRYPFDVEKGGLLRIYVFHTGKDEYAVLVTAAQIIMDRFDVRALFRAAMGLPEGKTGAVPPILYNVQMEAKMNEYWKKLLAAPPRLAPLPWELADVQPHHYKQRACCVVFPNGLFSDLMTEAKGNRLMLMAFLATAWGLLLQIEGRHKDLCFCLIAPARKAQEEDAWRPFNMVPVRQTIDNDETVENFVKRQFQQLVISKPYACFDWESFGNFLGGEGKPFNHFLDFYDFLSEEKPYSSQPAAPEGTVVSQHSWDAQSMKLSLYFRYTRSAASVVLLYDEDAFAAGTGERVTKSYLLTLQQMLTNRFETVSAFRANLEERLRAEKKFQAAYQEEEKARLQNAVSLLPLLQGEDAGMIQVFMKQGVLFTYYEGDRIEGMGRDLLFVAEGKLVRSIEDSEGWYRTLGIAKEGTWLNETVMLEERKALLAAEVLSERATILAISKESMENILALYPNLWPKITAHAIAQLETFQRLWAQS